MGASLRLADRASRYSWAEARSSGRIPSATRAADFGVGSGGPPTGAGIRCAGAARLPAWETAGATAAARGFLAGALLRAPPFGAECAERAGLAGLAAGATAFFATGLRVVVGAADVFFAVPAATLPDTAFFATARTGGFAADFRTDCEADREADCRTAFAATAPAVLEPDTAFALPPGRAGVLGFAAIDHSRDGLCTAPKSLQTREIRARSVVHNRQYPK